MIPGFINVQLDMAKALLLRAGGALAVFVVVFFYNPAALLRQQDQEASGSIPLPPATLPSGDRFPAEQQRAFLLVWEALVMLDMAGGDLWKNVTRSTLSNFADRYRTALESVGKHALFFFEGRLFDPSRTVACGGFLLRRQVTSFRHSCWRGFERLHCGLERHVS